MTELHPQTRELLARARWADEPDRLERERNRQRLSQRLAASGLAMTALAKGASASSIAVLGSHGGTLGKLVLVWISAGAVAGMALGGAYYAAEARFSSPAVPPSVAVAAQSRPIVSADSSGAADSPVSAVRGTLRSETASGPSATRFRRFSPTTPAGQAERAESTRAQADASGSLQGGQTPPDLSRALEALRHAQGELVAGRPDRALVQLERYAREEPTGPMGEERQALSIVALCQLGNARGVDEARRFLRQTANSPLATRVQAACRP